MTTSAREKVVKLAQLISQNLAFRQSADDLFSYISDLRESNIIVDFSEIKSITSSFAHQYLMNKKTCQKHIIEIDMPTNAVQMFELVERRISQPTRTIKTKSLKITEVTC